VDKVDHKILAALDGNPKITTMQLARSARVSQQVADYRLKRLQHRGVIAKFGTIINLKALGLEHYRIFFTLNPVQKGDAIFSYLKSRKGVYWAARTGGTYDLVVILFVRDFGEFDVFMDEFNARFVGLVKDYKSCYGIEHRIFKHKYLTQDRTIVASTCDDDFKDVDDLDRAILNEIKSDCRKSSLEIAAKTNVTYKTVLHRIKAMERERVILGYRLYLRSDEHRPFVLLLSFKNYAKDAEKRLLAQLAAEREVTQVVRLFGMWNLCVHVRTKDNESLQQFVIALRGKHSLIDTYEIIPIFEDIAIDLMPV
jgi:DNA-binding Lrp family transcriptional regulator